MTHRLAFAADKFKVIKSYATGGHVVSLGLIHWMRHPKNSGLGPHAGNASSAMTQRIGTDSLFDPKIPLSTSITNQKTAITEL